MLQLVPAAFVVATVASGPVVRGVDWRNVLNGGTAMPAPAGGYHNQPLAVQLHNGSWLVVLTDAGFKEGEVNQRVVSRVHLSPDLAAPGWGPVIDIQNDRWGPSAGWAVPLLAPKLGRVYAIFTYNAGNITTLPDSNESCRCQLVGGQWMRWSDDGGETWSPTLLSVPIRTTSIDRENPWHGATLQGWTVSKPIVLPSGAVLLPYTKVGLYLQGHTRTWALRSDNILSEPDPAKVSWTTWPAGDGGRTEGCGPIDGGDISEEGGVLSLGGPRVLYIYRTANGWLNECVSADGGESWTPRRVAYAAGGHVKGPRGPLTARRLSSGEFLLLFFNNGWPGYSGANNATRNPYFLALGILDPGEDDVVWSQPEIVLYGRGWTAESAVAPAYDLAYPDIVEQPDGSVVALVVRENPPGSACNNTDFLAIGGCGVSAHTIPASLIAGLRKQLAKAPTPLVSRDLLFDRRGGSAVPFPAPAWPDLNVGPGGLTLEAWIDVPAHVSIATVASMSAVLDCIGPDGHAGIVLRPGTSGDGSVELELRWGPGSTEAATLRSERGLLVPGQRLHLAAIVDAGPQMVYFIANGRFCDGGDAEVFGYRFFRFVGNVSGATTSMCTVGGSEVVRMRAYGDRLTVSEVIGNYRAWPGAAYVNGLG